VAFWDDTKMARQNMQMSGQSNSCSSRTLAGRTFDQTPALRFVE
jgi:hypothetical protein